MDQTIINNHKIYKTQLSSQKQTAVNKNECFLITAEKHEDMME